MELKGKNEKGFPYSVILNDNVLVLIEEYDSRGNVIRKYISLDEINEIKYLKETRNLIIKLKKEDRLIKVREIENYNIVNEFVELTNKKLSNKQLNKEKQKKNTNNGFKDWLNRQNKENPVALGFIGICLIVVLILGVNAALSPKITPLSISEPKDISNSEIGKYTYKNITIDSSTNQITISGKTDSKATVKVYVKYNYGYTPDATDIRGYSDTKERTVAVDPNTGAFNFKVDVNPNDSGPSYVFIEAKSPDKEKNGLELIIIYPDKPKTTIKSTPTSTSSSSTPRYETSEYWYGIGKGDGIVERPKDYSIVNSKWGSAYEAGYAEGYAEFN